MLKKIVKYTILLLTLGCAIFFPVSAKGVLNFKKDLKSDWMVYSLDRYEPFVDRKTKASTIYFWIQVTNFSGDYLRISGTEPLTVFINGQLIKQTKSSLSLRIDSLASALSSSNLLVAIHQNKIRSAGLETIIEALSTNPTVSTGLHDKPLPFFRDFVIVALLILLVMLITIIHLNPKLAADYFSVRRIFSQRESEDAQVYMRVTSSTNILFYIYGSLMLGFYLMIIFHGVAWRYPMALNFQADSFFSSLIQWIELSSVILVIFFFKIVLVYSTARLFGVREVAGVHFFNWVRVLLIVFGLLTGVLFFYFITHGQSQDFQSALLSAVMVTLTGWMIIIFFKLNGKMGYSVFHLFSYICATELIPLLITMKVLYK